jgi:hypothetical protein
MVTLLLLVKLSRILPGIGDFSTYTPDKVEFWLFFLQLRVIPARKKKRTYFFMALFRK